MCANPHPRNAEAKRVCGQTFVVFGVLLNVLAGSLLSPFGRKYIVMITNVYAKSVGYQYGLLLMDVAD